MTAAPLPIAAVEFDRPVEVEARLERLLATIRAPRPAEGYLPLAEEMVAACPAESDVLIMAATAAVLDGQPRRALVFLKRHSKRYFPSAPHHLLHALALNQEKKRVAARALLEQHGLAEWGPAYHAFAGGHTHVHWLFEQLAAILGWEPPAARRRGVWAPALSARAGGTAPKKNAPQAPASKAASKSPAATTPRRAKGAAAERTTLPAKPATPAASPAPPPAIAPLARVEIDIPCRIDIDLEPMLAALAAPPETDGRWWILRERFAHLGLAQGFDELLCLPHLTGVEPLWHQIETVRKVLKQFRGRVLLADEVGLGKTIEAGMVLKEYALRGMAEQRSGAHARPRWSGNGARSWRPSSVSPSTPPMTRCFARTRPRSGTSRASSPRSRRRGGRSMPDASARASVRSRHRRRGAPSARPLEPELETGRRPQQALPAAVVGDAGAERPDRALQSC